MNTLSEETFPLCETLHNAIQQGATHTHELTHKLHTLHTLQVFLSEIEQTGTVVFADLQHKERNISVVLCDIELLQNNIVSLETQTHNILLENLQLQHSIQDQSENTHTLFTGYSTYRTKLEKFKECVCAADRQTNIFKQLKEKELQVSKLTQTLRELKEDLQKPKGQSVHQAQKDIDTLKAIIYSSRQTVSVKKSHLKKEEECHSQLKKDIEIENRRFDAIIKRLHCQLRKVQTKHKQISTDVTHMKKELEELKSQLTTRS